MLCALQLSVGSLQEGCFGAQHGIHIVYSVLPGPSWPLLRLPGMSLVSLGKPNDLSGLLTTLILKPDYQNTWRTLALATLGPKLLCADPPSPPCANSTMCVLAPTLHSLATLCSKERLTSRIWTKKRFFLLSNWPTL